RAEPHATARRMLSKSPLGSRERPNGTIHTANRQARRQRAERSMRTTGAQGEDGLACLGGGGLAIPRPHLAERQSDVVVDWVARLHVSVRVRALRPKGGCEEMGAKRIPLS